MSKSKAAVDALAEMDPQFAELCDTLFGKSVDPTDVWAYVYTPEGVAKMLADSEVAKANPDQADVNTGSTGKKGALVAVGTLAAGGGAAAVPGVRRGVKAAFKATGRRKPKDGAQFGDFSHMADGAFKGRAETANLPVRKEDAHDVVWECEFAKTDDEKRQVFGWASIVKMDGKDVIDRQGDWISPEEIEKAAYTYVVKSRTGGHQHKRSETGEAFKAADMIESFVITDEKVEKMGLPESTPRGWWVGYHVSDDDAWARIKDGRITGFSIHGRGKRQEVSA